MAPLLRNSSTDALDSEFRANLLQLCRTIVYLDDPNSSRRLQKQYKIANPGLVTTVAEQQAQCGGGGSMLLIRSHRPFQRLCTHTHTHHPPMRGQAIAAALRTRVPMSRIRCGAFWRRGGGRA